MGVSRAKVWKNRVNTTSVNLFHSINPSAILQGPPLPHSTLPPRLHSSSPTPPLPEPLSPHRQEARAGLKESSAPTLTWESLRNMQAKATRSRTATRLSCCGERRGKGTRPQRVGVQPSPVSPPFPHGARSAPRSNMPEALQVLDTVSSHVT